MAKDMMRTDRNGFSVIDGYSDKKTLVGVMHDIARSGMIDDFTECEDFRKVSKKAEAEEWLIPSNKVEAGEYYFEVDFEFGYFCLCLVADTTKAEPTETVETTTETSEAPVKMTVEQIERYGENYSNGRMTNTEACATCCEHCTKKFECPHAEAYRRLPRTAGGLGLCPNLADAKNAVEVVATYKESVIRKAEPTQTEDETSEADDITPAAILAEVETLEALEAETETAPTAETEAEMKNKILILVKNCIRCLNRDDDEFLNIYILELFKLKKIEPEKYNILYAESEQMIVKYIENGVSFEMFAGREYDGEIKIVIGGCDYD